MLNKGFVSLKKKNYDRAVDIAAQPLGILNHIKNGSITVQDLKHFTQMYPELHTHLAKEMTKRITENQMADEKPEYKTRQGLSAFLGAPVDSTFTPQNMMAVQAIFANQNAQKQQAAQQSVKTKKGTSKLNEVAKDYKTADQAAQSWQNSAH